MQDRCCCSKESTGSIPIMRIIDKLDALYAKNDMAEAGRVLEYWEKEARALNDRRGLSEILSEEIGYYRSTGDKQKGLRAVDDALNRKSTRCLREITARGRFPSGGIL